MINRAIDFRIRKIEKQRSGSYLDRLFEAELIDQKLVTVCSGYPSVNAAAEAFRASPKLEDHYLADQLD